MVATCSPACPLEDDGKIWIGGGDVKNLTDTVDRARLGRNVVDSGLSESPDNHSDLLRQRHTGRNAETFNGEALTAHFLPERKLEGELTGVDVQGIQGDTNASRNVGCNFGAEATGL